jgi:hypothetical protein
MLNDLSKFRLCGPSDDPDEQTNVVESYRYILTNVKVLSAGLVPTDISEQLEALQPNSIEDIYDVFKSRAYLDAIAADIEAVLDEPISDGAAGARWLLSAHLIDALSKVNTGSFDTTKLRGYCKEINASFYHGNYVACLLLMRTVLNHVPPVFGHATFAQVAANSGKSLKENWEHLDEGLRKLADLYAHQPIRSKEQYPTKGQVEPFKPQFELLIQEVLNKL